ncbi:MAG: glutaredoxin family protein [Pseudomonadota bacterium]|nr:glutaredoxin family protein [Pseudomonadota bacterium]HJO36187.1 glutaredoxin family protein [Gammaproteobacteria bacterium]
MNLNSAPVLTVYGRPDCHLCTELWAQLQPLLADHRVAVRYVDIDGDAELTRRYALRIPVLAAQDAELCEYRLDRERLQAYLDAHATDR